MRPLSSVGIALARGRPMPRLRHNSAAGVGRSSARASQTTAASGAMQRRTLAPSRALRGLCKPRQSIRPSPGWSGAARSAQTLRASSLDAATLPRYLPVGFKPSAMACRTTTIDALENACGIIRLDAIVLLRHRYHPRHSARHRRLSSRQRRGHDLVLLTAATPHTPTPTTTGEAGMVLLRRYHSRQTLPAIELLPQERESQVTRRRTPPRPSR